MLVHPPSTESQVGAAEEEPAERKIRFMTTSGKYGPPPRTKWTRRVLHPVLIGQYGNDGAWKAGKERGTREGRHLQGGGGEDALENLAGLLEALGGRAVYHLPHRGRF